MRVGPLSIYKLIVVVLVLGLPLMRATHGANNYDGACVVIVESSCGGLLSWDVWDCLFPRQRAKSQRCVHFHLWVDILDIDIIAQYQREVAICISFTTLLSLQYTHSLRWLHLV